MEKVSILLSQGQAKALFLTMGNSLGVSLRLLAELVGDWENTILSTDEEFERMTCTDLQLDMDWEGIAAEAEGLAQAARTLEKLAEGLRPRGKLELGEEEIRELSWHIDPEEEAVLVGKLHRKLGLTEEQRRALLRR